VTQNPISNYQSSVALTQAFVTQGVFPPNGGAAGGAFLDEIFTYAFGFDPGGTLGANGQLLPINTNTAVFSVIGTTYGGNGTSNFALPNLNGVTVIGVGTGPGLNPQVLGQQTGSPSVTLTPAELPPSLGGTSQPFNNYQSSLTMTYMICVQGIFPSQGGGSASLDLLGDIDVFAGNYVPTDYLPCDGRLLSIAQNTALFSVIGTTYGGDGKTTFALPDLRGRTIVGASGAVPEGSVLGQQNVSLTNAQVPNSQGVAGQPFNNEEPSLAMEYLIATSGIFPSNGGGGSVSPTLPFLGQIQAFAGNFVPSGWALANGQLLSIAQNQALFALLGTTYGGDGITTFALPNLGGATVVGTGSTATLGQTLGSNATTINASEIPPTSITAESAASPGGTYIGVGKTVTFTIKMSGNVIVTEGGAAPTLQMNDGETAIYSGVVGAATGQLTFAYTAQAGYNPVDLKATAFNALSAGTTIVDGVGNNASFSNFTTIDTGVQVYTATTAPAVHANDISRSGEVTGPYNFIDLLNLEASYGDLIQAFGTNTQAMQNWFNANEPSEQRPDTFDGLDYIASYSDLISAYKSAGSEKAALDAGAAHFITNGSAEGRTTTFNGLDYIASYGDLIKAFGVNGDAGAYHYIENGASEGRTTTFDGLDYIASYSDLIKAFGANEQAGAAHFIGNGYAEGRTTTFDGLDYIAGYTDLMTAFGANNDAGASHYITNGLNEGRSAHAFDVAAYETAHPDLSGKFASPDAFLAAYISTYAKTGTFLT
jgi:microcystin-dependent protein